MCTGKYIGIYIPISDTIESEEFSNYQHRFGKFPFETEDYSKASYK